MSKIIYFDVGPLMPSCEIYNNIIPMRCKYITKPVVFRGEGYAYCMRRWPWGSVGARRGWIRRCRRWPREHARGEMIGNSPAPVNRVRATFGRRGGKGGDASEWEGNGWRSGWEVHIQTRSWRRRPGSSTRLRDF